MCGTCRDFNVVLTDGDLVFAQVHSLVFAVFFVVFFRVHSLVLTQVHG